MIREQKNINTLLVCWALICVMIRPAHYLFFNYDLDVFHLNYTIHLFNITYNINDFFPLYDPPIDHSFDIGYYLYELALNMIIVIQAYMNQQQSKIIKAIAEPHREIWLSYRRTYWVLTTFFVLSLYYLTGYVLYKGQYFHGWPLLITMSVVGFILHIREIITLFRNVKKAPYYFKIAKDKIYGFLRGWVNGGQE